MWGFFIFFLDVLPGSRGLWFPVVLLPALAVFSTGAAEERAAQDRQAGRRPADKQGGAKLEPEMKKHCNIDILDLCNVKRKKLRNKSPQPLLHL